MIITMLIDIDSNIVTLIAQIMGIIIKQNFFGPTQRQMPHT